MPAIDLRDRGGREAPAVRDCDICIVGSGPAGATLAAELSGSGLRVSLLESGAVDRDPAADRLNEVQSVGHPREPDQWLVRNRIVGGSSHTWGGRCAPFDSMDFQPRPWVPSSGWPLTLGDLETYLDRSAAHLGLRAGTGFSDRRFWELAGRPAPATAPDPDALLPFFWQFSREPHERYRYEYRRFGRRLVERLGSNVTLVSGATVVGVDPVESGGAVRCVRFVDPAGRQHFLNARTVVLCTGGIENARILLTSDARSAEGLGNQRGLVGRYLMDHLRGPVGAFDVSDAPRLQAHLGRYNISRNLFRAGVRLGPEVQRDEELLNCAAWMEETRSIDDPWDAIRRLLGGWARIPADLIAVVSNSALLVRGFNEFLIKKNGVPRKFEALEMFAMCEQIPDSDSRVTLSDQRDAFGVRLPKIDWRVHPAESRTMRRMAVLMAEQFQKMGLPPLTLADWVLGDAPVPSTFLDVAHPSGTTRMSVDPAAGVVDASCRVHGVDGLYVAGSSVFPTSGHCNPTQMIVALSIRLADHLKDEAARSAAVDVRAEAGGAPAQVLVTGATGRIGHRVVQDLLDRGYRVLAATSKDPRPFPAVRGLEWRQIDLLNAAGVEYDDLVAGCSAVFHLAAEIGEMDLMQRVNADATALLAQAAERAGIAAFCYTSTVSVYGSGRRRVMTEDAPVLTVDHDVRSEYIALPYVREYGRTKLAGEVAIRNAARSTRYVIVRPTVVVDVAAIVEIREWNRSKRILAGHRHSHHVYVRDVSDAMIWATERALSGHGDPGGIETFNVSEDEYPAPTHADFMRRAHAASADGRFRVPIVPGIVDWVHDLLRFRMVSVRNPLWRMRFPNDHLRASGFRFRSGMARAYALAVDEVRVDREPR